MGHPMPHSDVQTPPFRSIRGIGCHAMTADRRNRGMGDHAPAKTTPSGDHGGGDRGGGDRVPGAPGAGAPPASPVSRPPARRCYAVTSSRRTGRLSRQLRVQATARRSVSRASSGPGATGLPAPRFSKKTSSSRR